jgi:hypothetical protein
MQNNYLRSFIIGSSFPVLLSFYVRVQQISDKIKNYTFDSYSILAPMYLGIMNAISLYLSNKYNLDLRTRLLYISIVSAITIITFAKLTNSYNYTTKEWLYYAIKIFFNHIVTYNIIIYTLELYV